MNIARIVSSHPFFGAQDTVMTLGVARNGRVVSQSHHSSRSNRAWCRATAREHGAVKEVCVQRFSKPGTLSVRVNAGDEIHVSSGLSFSKDSTNSVTFSTSTKSKVPVRRGDVAAVVRAL